MWYYYNHFAQNPFNDTSDYSTNYLTLKECDLIRLISPKGIESLIYAPYHSYNVSIF